MLGTFAFASNVSNGAVVIGRNARSTCACAIAIGCESCSCHTKAVVLGAGRTSKVTDTVHVSNLFFYAATGPHASDSCFYAAGGTAGQTYMLCVGSDSYLTVAGYN